MIDIQWISFDSIEIRIKRSFQLFVRPFLHIRSVSAAGAFVCASKRMGGWVKAVSYIPSIGIRNDYNQLQQSSSARNKMKLVSLMVSAEH